jgi:hypothetical protein
MRNAALWRLMFGSLVAGVALLVGGASVGTDIGALAAAYGSLVIGAALFLGVGLAIRGRVWQAIVASRKDVQPAPGTVLGHRVF